MRRFELIVFSALVLLSPWPILALGIRPPLNEHLLAAPAVRPSLDAPLSTVFSRGRYFLLFDLRTGRYAWAQNPFRKADHAAGLRSAYLLMGRRVGLVLARRIGPEPFFKLSQKGVRIFDATTPAGAVTLRAAIQRYQQRGLPLLQHPTAPSHYGLTHRRPDLTPAAKVTY